MYLDAWQRTWKTEWTETVANLIDVRKKSKNILYIKVKKKKKKSLVVIYIYVLLLFLHDRKAGS
jgi:hypothetical protein